MKRIFTFDLIRAIAIIGVVFVHTLQHSWSQTANVEAGTQEAGPMVLILFYILTMAGVFYVIMGAVNAYMIHHRIKNKRNNLRQMVLSGVIMGIFLIFSHYMFRAFFSADSGIFYFLARDGEFLAPSAKWLIGTSTLAMLGWTSIIVPIVIALLFRNDGIRKVRRNYWILGITGSLILAVTPFLRNELAPVVVDLISEGSYLRAIALGAFVYDLFPIFPYIGYGLYGAMIGIALARGEHHKRIKLFLLLSGIGWMLLGFIVNAQYGGPDPSLYREFSTQAVFNKTFLQFSQLGMFMIFVLIGLSIFDMISHERGRRRQGRFSLLRKFSLVSLTIYLVEGFIMGMMYGIFNFMPFMSGWNNSLGIVALAALFHLLLWTLAVVLWEKVEFKGSIEWLIIKLIEKLSGKRSEKFNLKREMIVDDIPDMVKEERPGLIIPKR